MVDPIPSFRASDADEYEHFMGRWSRRLAGPFLDFAGVQAGDRVLDVGCGTGVITAALAERGCTAVGVDASEPYINGATELKFRVPKTVTDRQVLLTDDGFNGRGEAGRGLGDPLEALGDIELPLPLSNPVHVLRGERWGAEARPRDAVFLDMWEDYLEEV